MSSATASTEVIVHPPLDGDAHPATSHLQDIKATFRYLRDFYTYAMERADLARRDQVALASGAAVVVIAIANLIS